MAGRSHILFIGFAVATLSWTSGATADPVRATRPERALLSSYVDHVQAKHPGVYTKQYEARLNAALNQESQRAKSSPAQLEAAVHNLARAVAQVDRQPNSARYTWAPVVVENAAPALIDRYLKKGLLKKGNDGTLYVRVIYGEGDNVAHGRSMTVSSGRKGKNRSYCTIKGGGNCTDIKTTKDFYKEANINLQLKYQLSRDPDNPIVGGFDGDSARWVTTGAPQRFLESFTETLQKAVGDKKLAKLIKKHDVSSGVLPDHGLSLKLKALPVAIEDKDHREIFKKNLSEYVVPNPMNQASSLVFVNADKYYPHVFNLWGRQPQHYVYLYETSAPSAVRFQRRERKDNFLRGPGFSPVASLDWEKAYKPEEAVEILALLSGEFERYGGSLRYNAATGKFSCRSLSNPARELNGRAAAWNNLEGSAVINGLVLRALFDKHLTSQASSSNGHSLGGLFFGKDSWFRFHGDIDTIGEWGANEDVRNAAAKVNAKLAQKGRAPIAEDVLIARFEKLKEYKSAAKHLNLAATTLGLGAEEVERARRLMMDIATGKTL